MLQDFTMKIKNKRYFDVTNKKDLEVYKNFLVNKSWGSACCPFLVEEPYISIPYMIQEKIAKHVLGVQNA
jgi:hypothetical protein